MNIMSRRGVSGRAGRFLKKFALIAHTASGPRVLLAAQVNPADFA